MGYARTLFVGLAVFAAGAGAVAQEGAPVIEACASDPNVLGLERIVEVDQASGPVFGGGHPHTGFLNDHEIVLTFDDGPLRPYTRAVLKALAAHCTKATFFMVGRMAAADPAMVREVLAQGHTVGSHTWSHLNLAPLGFFKSRNEFELGLSAVTKAAGRPIAPFFRFPYLSDNRTILNYIRKREQATFFIDIDSKDFRTHDPNAAYERVLHDLAREHKGIILMHDIQPSTAGMIKRLLDTLHQKGYKVVHVLPKSTATTIADFDKSPAKDVTAKQEQAIDAAISGEIAKPAVAPLPAKPAGTAPTAQPPAQTSPIRTGSTQPTAPAAEEPEILPWSKTTGEVARRPPASPKKQQVRKQPDELPWQLRIFQN